MSSWLQFKGRGRPLARAELIRFYLSDKVTRSFFINPTRVVGSPWKRRCVQVGPEDDELVLYLP